MSIKKSQAILKRSIDLKFSIWFTLGSENDDLQFVTIRTFFSFLFPLSSFLFPLSSFLFPPSFPLSSQSVLLGDSEIDNSLKLKFGHFVS